MVPGKLLINVNLCRRCGGRMRLIATIEDLEAVRKAHDRTSCDTVVGP